MPNGNKSDWQGVTAISTPTASSFFFDMMVNTATSAASSSSSFAPTKSWLEHHCPCWTDASVYQGYHHRSLQDEEPEPPPPVWQTVVVSVTLAVMLLFMMTDKIGPDWVMTAGLVFLMACEIVSIPDGLKGFANEGVLTVMALFVVAEGLSRTGALDYYLGLILGTPKSVAGAQIRLMVPIATLSAFLNNTPIVAVMIPLTLRWAKKIGVPKEQLLMPLSFATILGGTCTLVGTSTNLVVSGLLEKNYPDEASGNIGLFDVAIYGVPNAMIGLAYMLAFSPFLLPMGRRRRQGGAGGANSATGSASAADSDDLLLGAVVKPWSPAAGRTYKRSGLGDSGGIVLAHVLRAATGNIHRAVSGDFVFSVGDELYFTGSPEVFGEFCDHHGLEIITTENHLETSHHGDAYSSPAAPSALGAGGALERLRQIRYLSDQIEGREDVEPGPRPIQLIVTLDETEKIVLVGVDCEDHAGLMKQISDAIVQQGLNVRHSEAKVIADRSLSVWRCETLVGSSSTVTPRDLDDIWFGVYQHLKDSDRDLVVKTSGARVVRAYVPKSSSLVDKKPTDVNFRALYGASIVAYQKGGKNYLLDVELDAGDLLVLHVSEASPLVSKPPPDFYDNLNLEDKQADVEVDLDGLHRAWKDLRVVFEEEGKGREGGNRGVPQGEFLTAFTVPPNSNLQNKTLEDVGYVKLAGVALISIERPDPDGTKSPTVLSPEDDPLQVGDILWYSGGAEAIADLQRLHGLAFYHDTQKKNKAVHLTERRLVQAVVAKGSPLVGQTVREAKFRQAYGGVVIAIQRGSDRVHDFPANVQLKTGDVLLVEAGPSFAARHYGNFRTFALVSEVGNSSPPRPRLFLLCVVMIAASLAVAAVDLQSLLVTASLVGIVMVSCGVVTQQEARDCLQWDLYVTIACAFGIGTAMQNSGVAEGIATFLVNIGLGLGIGGKS
jgi:di/tricarboxylate transporter